MNAIYFSRRCGVIVLIALWLGLPPFYTSYVAGQGSRRRAPAKKTSTASPRTTTTKPQGDTATQAAQTPLVPDTTKPGTVMSNQVGIEFVYLPSGSFMMGSNQGSSDERPAHRVTIRKGFYMGRYEVTQAQWQVVMNDNPSNFKGEDLPVEQVSWEDAQNFIRKLNERNEPFIYRLPTEAEWEYACHAQMGGEGMGQLDQLAWYFNNSGGKTRPVGQKQPNSWGLYDTLGNVWEWCEDIYHDSYRGAPVDGSAWLSGGDPRYRVMRGGSWTDNAFYCRVNERIRATPTARQRNSGLRVVAVAR